MGTLQFRFPRSHCRVFKAAVLPLSKITNNPLTLYGLYGSWLSSESKSGWSILCYSITFSNCKWTHGPIPRAGSPLWNRWTVCRIVEYGTAGVACLPSSKAPRILCATLVFLFSVARAYFIRLFQSNNWIRNWPVSHDLKVGVVKGNMQKLSEEQTLVCKYPSEACSPRRGLLPIRA